MFSPQEIIRKKRDNKELSKEEIEFFVNGIDSLNSRLNKKVKNVSAEQISALAMSIYFNGMTAQESSYLTSAMQNSGKTLSWDILGEGAPVLDKHSTGGVGDLVSLVLAPMVASIGGFVPMISGRGLGHTGGTLDKFDSIVGYNTTPDLAVFQKVVKDVGCSIIGQTADLAPADKVIYSIRDVTATVESIPLITASILSKKLSAGLNAMVMDVKVGNGAFMGTLEKSSALAKSIENIAKLSSLKVNCVLTDMNQPLSSKIGNALEVMEAVEFLSNNIKNKRLYDVVMKLCAEMILLGDLSDSHDEAYSKLERSLASGAAMEKFSKMVFAMGGPIDFAEKYKEYLPKANIVRDIFSKESGFVSYIDTRAIGITILHLGGSRIQTNDSIDYSVGLSNFVQLGQKVDVETPIVTIHARNEDDFQKAKESIYNSIKISQTVHKTPSLFYS